MSMKVSLSQLRSRLPEFLDQVVKTGREYVVQRDGKDCAVLVSARQWRRRNFAARLDALGPEYRFGHAKQARMEMLLAKGKQSSLSPSERHELKALLDEAGAVMLRRAQALDRLS